MALEYDIIKVLEQTRDEIRGNMQTKGINASGRTSASIRVVSYKGGVALIGGGKDAAPVPTLEVGREGGKVPKGFYHIIKQWTLDKGIQFDTERDRSTFSYFLSRKIALQGTARNKINEDVYSTAVTNAVGRISDLIGTEYNRQISSALRIQTTERHF